jgi:hypothetical protein
MKKHTLFIFSGFFIALFISFVLNVFAVNNNVGSLDGRNITPQTVGAMFKPPLDFLNQKQLPIKVLVPTFIINTYPKGYPDPIFYAIPHSDRSDRYWIDVTGNPNCDGATSCSNMVFQGEKVGNPEVLSLDAELALAKESYARVEKDKRDPNPPASLFLDNGMRVVFHPWFLFWHYTSSYLSWVDNDVRYQVIMKKGDKSEMLKMANSIYK